MLHIVSTIVVLLILAGVVTRRTPRVHLRWMTAAFILDMALLLYIELTCQAVEQVAAGTTPLLLFHAGVSLLVVGAYAGQIALSRRMLAGIRAPRQAHLVLGITFCALRCLNYVTSVMVYRERRYGDIRGSRLQPCPTQA